MKMRDKKNAMQSCTRQLISRIGRNDIILRCSYRMKKTMAEQEQRDTTLICPDWEEAIIKEHGKPDVPFDLMQKDTIEKIINNKNFKEQPHAETMTESST